MAKRNKKAVEAQVSNEEAIAQVEQMTGEVTAAQVIEETNQTEIANDAGLALEVLENEGGVVQSVIGDEEPVEETPALPQEPSDEEIAEIAALIEEPAPVSNSNNVGDQAEVIMRQAIAVIDERVEKADNDNLKTNWNRERAHFAKTSMARFFLNQGVDILPALKTMAIYATQKLRKLGTGKIDNYTLQLLRCAKVLADKEVPFSSDLQWAALSKEAPVQSDTPVAKLPSRLKAVKGTGSTQASSSRAALEVLGMARVTRDKALVVNFEHPLVKAALEGSLEQVSSGYTINRGLTDVTV